MIRTLGGLAGGVGIAILIVMLVEALGNQVAAPVTLEVASTDAVARTPASTLLFPLIGWFVGPLVGGMAAIWFGRENWLAWAVSAAVLIGVVLRFAMTSHPVWMLIAGLLVPVAAAWLAQRLAPRRAPRQR